MNGRGHAGTMLAGTAQRAPPKSVGKKVLGGLWGAPHHQPGCRGVTLRNEFPALGRTV